MTDRTVLLLDLDGVLVDTEGPVLDALADAFGRHGVPGDVTATSATFRGKNLMYCLDELAHVLGRTVPAGFVDDVRRSAHGDITAIDGAEHVLSSSIPYRIVTNSTRTEARTKLLRAGLGDLVDETSIVAVDDVGAAKPAPDLHRTALQALAVRADEAVAVEDSLTGLAAARAAGVHAVGFVDGPDHAARLRHGGFETISHLTHVTELVTSRTGSEEGTSWFALPSASS